MGVLACESGVEELKLGLEVRNVGYDKILLAYGVNADEKFPAITSYTGSDEFWDFENEDLLLNIIVKLNDWYRLTFKEIGEFLEVTFDL